MANVGTLSAEQVALLGSLVAPSDAQVSKAVRVSDDIADAFKNNVLATIASEVTLGGQARADSISAALSQYEALEKLEAVLLGLTTLASNNRLLVGSELGKQANALYKLYGVYVDSDPALKTALKELVDWEQKHHRGGKSAKSGDAADKNAKATDKDAKAADASAKTTEEKS